MKEYAKEIKFNVPEKSDIDKGLMEMLKFFLDTESKVKIYLYLLKSGKSSSDNIAEGTSIYPSTCREALDSMLQMKVIEKYEEGGEKYTAVSPSKLVERKIGQLEKELNDFLKLEELLKDSKEIRTPFLPFKIKIERVDNPITKDEEWNLLIRIDNDLIDFISNAAKNTYPNEFAAFLREDKGIISEVVLSPFSIFGKNSSTISHFSLPIDHTIIGSVHSHPGRNGNPSEGDLNFFSRYGKVHIIVRYPYEQDDYFVYSRSGESLEYEIIWAL